MANLRRLMTSPPPPALISTVRSSLSTSITRLISTSPETLPNINNQNEQDPIKQTQNHENENEQEEEDDLEGDEPDMNKDTGEIGGPKGPEPTRYGDWERNGRCSDF
ncbi:succinate dehydrogenase assembly factor 4, mitochondrial [Tanacetum coccineum]